MVVRLFISYNVNSYTDKKASLYQHSPLLFLSDVEWLADIMNDNFKKDFKTSLGMGKVFFEWC